MFDGTSLARTGAASKLDNTNGLTIPCILDGNVWYKFCEMK